MKLFLIRGPSGTGKSTIANWIINKSPDIPEVVVWQETDQFFTDPWDKYHFKMGKLKQAHAWNQLCVEQSMLTEVPLIVVTNTFIAHWEMEHYLELAEEYHYAVNIIRTPKPWDPDVLFKRNEHNVPLDVIKRHINGYQPHDDEVEWTDMSIFNE